MMFKDLFELKGYCSIITGAAQGLGKYMAMALAELGSNIIIGDINYEKAIEAAKNIEELGVKVLPVKVDVRDKKQVENMIDITLKNFSIIDVLVNNAGITKLTNAENMNYSDWMEVIDTNLNAVFLVSQLVGRIMIKQNKGSIINISSMSGIIANHPQGQAAYNSSKAGVIMLTKSLASEWARYNIRVNTIAPGYMKIGVAEKYFREKNEMTKRWISLIPMGRPGEPSELGGIAIYLASEASSYVTVVYL